MDRKASILIVDDEVDICFLLSGFLKKHYPKVDSVNSLSEYYKIDLGLYDIVFLDNNLPDGSGFEEIQGIKNKYPQIKIVAISAFDTVAERRSAIEKGADIFLGKPFGQNEIKGTIDKFENHGA